MIKYDINIAIDIRGKLFTSIGFESNLIENDLNTVSFIDSIKLAEFDNYYSFGYFYDNVAQLGIGTDKNITKEQFKKLYHSYRYHYYQLSLESEYKQQ